MKNWRFWLGALFVVAGAGILADGQLLQGLISIVIGVILLRGQTGKISSGKTVAHKAKNTQDSDSPFRGFVITSDYVERVYDFSKIPEDMVLLDVETTGLGPEEHRIIEIAYLHIVNGEIIERYDQLLNPQRKIPAEAVKIHKITDQMVKKEPKFKNIASDLKDTLSGRIVAGYNVDFDAEFVEAEFKRIGMNVKLRKRLDILEAARRSFPKTEVPNYKLPTIKQYLKINAESHRALADCETSWTVLQKCVKQHRNWEAQRLADQAEKIAKMNEDEKRFIEVLKENLSVQGLSERLSYNILSDKTINFTLDTMQIGRVKLSGRKKGIQVLSTSEDEVSWHEVTMLEEALDKIPHWVKYAQEIID